jgi:hypothetical protein
LVVYFSYVALLFHPFCFSLIRRRDFAFVAVYC